MSVHTEKGEMRMKCNVKNVEVNYEVYGEGKPIIMIHGASVDHRLMSGCMEPIFSNRDGYKRIYFDLPGMGKTKREEWIISSDEVLEVVIGFIEKVIPNENFLVAGESYGGYLCRGILNKIPDRVEGLFLLCPSVRDYEKRNVPEHVVLKKDENLLSQLDSEDAEKFDAIQVVQSERIWNRYRDEILSGIRLSDKDFLLKLRESGYAFSFDDNLDQKFDKPTLILLGRQDSSVGYKDAWSVLDNFPRATFAVLDMAGHNLQIEQEELFNSLVAEWLQRVEFFPMKSF